MLYLGKEKNVLFLPGIKPCFLCHPLNVNKICYPGPQTLLQLLLLKIISIGIVLSWNMQLTSEYEEIASYQLYAYQEGSAPPSTTLWKKVGDVKALPLPMACTLTQVTHVVASRLLVIYRETLMLHQVLNKKF